MGVRCCNEPQCVAVVPVNGDGWCPVHRVTRSEMNTKQLELSEEISQNKDERADCGNSRRALTMRRTGGVHNG